MKKNTKINLDTIKGIEPSKSNLEHIVLPKVSALYNDLVQNNKKVIEDYLFWKDKIEEIQAHLSPTYTLNVLNNKVSGKVVNAKLKWKINQSAKASYYNIHIGKLSEYKKGLTDKQLVIDAKTKVDLFIASKLEIELKDTNNQYFILGK